MYGGFHLIEGDVEIKPGSNIYADFSHTYP
jgi:hypothetical protein